MTPNDTSTDLLIIGAGPGGYPAAFHAADLGMKVTLVDPEPNPGGVCLYRGCVPSKALLHAVAFLHEAEQAKTWGISVGKLEVDSTALRKWKDSVVESLTGGLGQLTRKRSINYVQGTASLKGPHCAGLKPVDGDARGIAFENVIVATGSVPIRLPDTPESDRIMSSREALNVDDVPERLLVVGAGYIGLELGQVYASLGAAVTVVEMLPEILSGADRDLVRLLEKRLKKQFSDIRTEIKVTGMTETDDGIRVTFDGGGDAEQTFDKVIMAVGRAPFTDGVGLDNTRANLTERGFIEVDEQKRTAEPSVYAIGDVVGQPMLAHKATQEARVAVEAIAGKNGVDDARAIPAVVFSDPEIAWCGLTETEANRQGRKVVISRFPWAASGRAKTISRQDGLTKLICDPTSGRVLGAGLVGKNAGELIAEPTLAMEMGAIADDLALTVHTHPTLSETLMEAAQAFAGKSTHYLK